MSLELEIFSQSHKCPGNGVLLLDSGVGSLAIANQINQLLPEVATLSVGDQLNFPYGSKSEEYIRERVLSLLDFSVSQFKPAVIVIACNTVSTFLLPMLREKYSLPIVGVVPAVKPAAENSKSKIICILSTEATSQRVYLDNLINDFASDCQVLKVGCKRLASIAELKLSGGVVNLQHIREDLDELIRSPLINKIDSIVLGCTHFSLLVDEIKSLVADSVEVYDPAQGVARQVAQVFGQEKKSECFKSYFFTTNKNSTTKEKVCGSFGISRIFSI